MVFLKQQRLFLIALLVLFLPYMFISLYANPAADDFAYAHKAKSVEWVQAYLDEYMNWNGRYTSNALVLLNPLAFGSLFIYKIVPPAMLCLTVLGYLFFVSAVTGNSLKRPERCNISFLLSLLFLYQLPILPEGIYWYTGAVTYQLGNIAALVYAGLLIRYHQKIFVLKHKRFHLFLLTILLVLTIGFNEVIMLALVSFACLYLFVVYKNKLPYQGLAVYLLTVTLVFTAVVCIAPGNSTRESHFPDNHHFMTAVAFSVAQTARFFLAWVSSAPLLLLSVLFFYLNKQLSKNNKLFALSFYLSPLYSSLLLFVVIFITVFPAYWATGILGQHRTLNVGYYLFIPVWFINLSVWFNFYKNQAENVPPVNKPVYTILLIVIAASFFFTKNGYDVITDIFYGKARCYDRQMQERYARFVSPGDSVYLSPIVNQPRSLFLYDITGNPGHWLNKCYTIYYECESTVVLLKKN